MSVEYSVVLKSFSVLQESTVGYFLCAIYVINVVFDSSCTFW